MADRKSTAERIAEAELKKEQLANEIKRLERQHKEEERKARTKRLCNRGGKVEKLLPELITLPEEQFEIFVNTVLLTPHTRKILKELAGQAAAPKSHAQPAAPPAVPPAPQTVPSAKPPSGSDGGRTRETATFGD